MSSTQIILSLTVLFSLTISSVQIQPTECMFDPSITNCTAIEGGSCSPSTDLCYESLGGSITRYGYVPCSGSGCYLQDFSINLLSYPQCSVLNGPYNTSCVSSPDYCNLTFTSGYEYMYWFTAPCQSAGCCLFQDYQFFYTVPQISPNPCLPSPGSLNLSSSDGGLIGDVDVNGSCWLMYSPPSDITPQCSVGCDSSGNTVSNTSFVFFKTSWASCNFTLLDGNWAYLSPGNSYTSQYTVISSPSPIWANKTFTCEVPGWLTFVRVLGWIIFAVLVLGCCGGIVKCNKVLASRGSNSGTSYVPSTYMASANNYYSNNNDRNAEDERRKNEEWAEHQRRLEAIREESRAAQRRHEDNMRRQQEAQRNYQTQQQNRGW